MDPMDAYLRHRADLLANLTAAVEAKSDDEWNELSELATQRFRLLHEDVVICDQDRPTVDRLVRTVGERAMAEINGARSSGFGVALWLLHHAAEASGTSEAEIVQKMALSLDNVDRRMRLLISDDDGEVDDLT